MGTRYEIDGFRKVYGTLVMQYIKSAAQADKYRTGPPFKLQGSYRNMNKMAEKISAVMNDAELKQMIADHYVGEAQLLTTGAEENLLKLGELQNNLTEPQEQRWQEIKKDFARIKAAGGEDADSSTRLANQIANVTVGITDIGDSLKQDNELARPLAHIAKTLVGIEKNIHKFEEKTEDKPEVEPPQQDGKKKSSSNKLFKQIGQISEALAGIDQSLKAGQNLEKPLAHIAKSLTVLEKNINLGDRTTTAKSTSTRKKVAGKTKLITTNPK